MGNQRLNQPLRVITVDNHQIVRVGIKFLLEQFNDIEVVGEAQNGEEAVRLCQEVKPDVVLMDLILPGMNGAETTKAIKKKHPKIQVLILTSFLERDLIQQAMQAGAISYLLKDVLVDDLADAIRAAAVGQSRLSQDAIQALCNFSQPISELIKKLTQRQQEVLALLALGLTNEAIAQQMNLSPSTIRHHITQIFNKLQVKNRTEAATMVIGYPMYSLAETKSSYSQPPQTVQPAEIVWPRREYLCA